MFWNILKNDIVRGMFKRKYLYIIATVSCKIKLQKVVNT